MKKSEFSESQSNDRNLFVKTLKDAGWSFGGWNELFENDADLSPEALAEYSTESFEFRLSFFVIEMRLLLEMTEKNDGQAFGLHLTEYTDLENVLETITGSQMTLTKENCIEFFKELVQVCNEVLLETDDELVRLVED